MTERDELIALARTGEYWQRGEALARLREDGLTGDLSFQDFCLKVINCTYEHARLLMTAAHVGGVKLTGPQEARLRQAAGGRFLDLVYNQYEAGERGTLQGPKQEFRQASFLNTSEAAKEERAREFRENTRRYSGAAAADTFDLGLLRG